MQQLNDYLQEGLKVVFVGFNPSIRSGEVGHHYANPNNRFWKILYEAGLTPRKYSAYEDDTLLKLGYGMTNIVARPTKAADEITKDEYKKGRKLLQQKIEKYKPAIVCFVGKGVYQQYSGKKDVPWGLQSEQQVAGVYDYVAPSSSGLVRMKQEEIIDIYKELKAVIDSLEK